MPYLIREAALCTMKGNPFGSTHSHGDLHSLDIIEDRCGGKQRHGLPQRYSKGRFLGKGGFAKCFEVQDMESKCMFAAKIVAKTSIAKPRAMAKLRSEIAIHRSLDHQKVVKFYDYFEDNDFVYIILELCPSQTLNEFMRKRPSKRLSEPEAMFYLYDLIIALKYLHQRRVIHRDLKLGNLFLDADNRLKVGDFGLAAQLEHDNEKKRTICGTPNYIAPEILEGKQGHSYEVDIWSLGVILYTMIIGRPPFETSDVKTTYRKIRYNQYSFPETLRVSEQVKDLIVCILRTDPRSRPSLDDIIASPWFQSCRLPPPVPITIGHLAISPRILCGNSSARSETPERGVADFARIDSPVPRFPLRDRSPGSVPMPQATMPVQQTQQQQRGHSAAPLLPTGKQVVAQPSYSGSMTPGRYNASGNIISGRPPLTHWGNDENIVPLNGNIAACPDACMPTVAPSSPARQTLNGGGSAPCRTQDGQLLSCGSNGRLGIGSTAHAQGVPLRGGVCHASGRDPSPHMRITGPPPLSARMISYNASARSATSCSPRQHPQMFTSTTRLPPSGPTPRDGERRSTRTLGCVASDGGCGYAGSLSSPTALSIGQSSLPPQSSRTRFGTESPQSSAKHIAQFQQQELRPDTESADSRVQRSIPSPVPTSCERLHYSARRSERSSSTPALLHEGPLKESAFELSGRGVASGTVGSAPLSTHVDSSRSGSCGPAPSSGKYQRSTSPQPPCVMPELWVTKWVDYSSKYGVGYILSDGSVGVYFNDSTKIILAPQAGQFDYITRRTQEKPESRSTHTFENYPDDLKKKVTLLRHFKNYMLTNVLEKKDGATVGESSLQPIEDRVQPGRSLGQAPYVRKWTRNRHAIMFQLSNKMVQVIFFDKTEAVLSSKLQVVTYVDKKGQVCSHPLSNALDVPSPELAKRLRYTKDILVSMLGARTGDLAAAVAAH